jgi:fucose permease
MSQRRVGNNRLVTVALTVILVALAIFATVAWMQDSTYGVVAVALWVLAIIVVVVGRRRARDRSGP